MDGATTQICARIKQEISQRAHLSGDEFSVALFQLHINPDTTDPQAILETLSPVIQSTSSLNQLPTEQFIELLTLMHVLENRVAPSPVFTDFYEIITRIGIEQIQTANWNFLSGAASILTYFTLANGTNQRIAHLERLMQTFDTVFIAGAENSDLARKTNDLLNEYSLATGIIGLLITLMKACQRLKNEERILDTVQSVAGWIETRMNTISRNMIDVNWESANLSFFPASVEQDSDLIQVSNELSWANGDLGHVFLLYLAAEFWQDSNYYRLAEQIGMYTLLRKDFTSTGISHAEFRNGSAGLIYTYDALWRYAKNNKYQQGAAFWHAQTADLLANDMTSAHYQHTFFRLLDGVVGTALIENAINRGVGREDWMDMMLL